MNVPMLTPNQTPPGTPGASTHWLDQEKNIGRLRLGFLIALAATVAAEFFVTLHPAFAIERLFGFAAAFGFFACALMILGARLLGAWLKRPDDYYASADDGDD